MRLSRRRFLSIGAGTAFLSAGDVLGQASTPLILRPGIDGDPRYARYASNGIYVTPASPVIFTTEVSRVYIFYPLQVTRSQVIVFSHGALTDPNTYRDLLWHWASHGYIVMAPLHDDAVLLNGPALRKRTDDSLSEWPVPSLLEDKSAWNKRLLACKSALDLAAPLTTSLGMEVDFTRPIIAGHGYGAFIANLLMGATVVDQDKKVVSFRDDRFFSSISLSPQGPGVMGLHEKSWENISSPMLGIVAENDVDFTTQPWQTKGQSFKLAKPGYKHFGLLTQGSSNSFSGQMAGRSDHERKLFEGLKAFTIAFVKAYGEYDPIAFKDVSTNFFQQNTLNAIKEYRR
jgi:hypothetical protein